MEVYFNADDKPGTFPFVWLRDNCRCSQCYEPSAQSRLILTRNLDVSIKPLNVKREDEKLVVTWPDQHVSTFTKDWLKERQFKVNEQEGSQQGRAHDRDIIRWGGEMQDKIPSVKYQDLLNDDVTLHKWLVGLEEVGIQLITNAPEQTGVLSAIGERVGFLRTTHYGEKFTVISKNDPNNLAYTNRTLGQHTDLPYYDYTAGMQMLHCINQVDIEGGENVFTDGFHVAEEMKRLHPEYYKTLTTTPVKFRDQGKDVYGHFDKVMVSPIIREEQGGKVTKISYNNHVRDSDMSLTSDHVIQFYEAMIQFEKMLNNKKYAIVHKLQNGEIACFHNYRVLHGRQGYKMLGPEIRHLEGGYVDWDELKSKRRVLERKLVK